MKKFAVAFVLISVISLCLPCFASAQTEGVKLPVIMYHSVLNSRTGVYTVSERQLESDFSALVKAGYTAVLPQEVVAYVDGKGTLPQKPIIITFDDGRYNNMYYALPLLKKYGLKAVFNVIGKFTEVTDSSGDVDNPNYSHLTWNEIAELSGGGVVEIGNHTYNMHNYRPRFGVGRKDGESDEAYLAALTADIGGMQSRLFNCTGKKCLSFAYPFGKYTDVADAVVQANFRMSFTCNEGVSTVRRGNPNSLFKLRRINRRGDFCSADLMRLLKKYSQ